ncbi:MAG: AAA family ATPase [Eubacteriaceae bacterium]|nr:AAA family ATPase [Eubacteriaceae bacterium]
MKKLPLGIQNFREIVDGDYVYIDKTRYIYNLVNDAKYYFLSRTRRFGKSLLLDTINEVFNGDKELFNGLWIYNSDYEFVKYPVLRLDMSNIANKNSEVLEESLLSSLKNIADEEGISIFDRIPSDVFKFLITSLRKKYNQRVLY